VTTREGWDKLSWFYKTGSLELELGGYVKAAKKVLVDGVAEGRRSEEERAKTEIWK
jgi:hypothetical protein